MTSAAAIRDVGMTRPLRVGFIGLGWIGRKRLDAISGCEGIEIAALADSDAQRLEEAAHQYPEAAPVQGIDRLLDVELDGVVIATPNACHAEQAIRCLSNGLAVFCQKPLAINAVEAEAVVDAARRADRLLAVDYCYRHLQGMQELRSAIVGGELGKIAALDLRFHNAYGPDKRWCFDRRLAGGGCVLDLGVHLIDLALWLQNDIDMELVSATRFSHGEEIHGEEGIEDLAFAEFRSAGGTIVRIACSWNAQIGCDAVIGADIYASQGGAAWRNVRGSFFDFKVDVFNGTQRRRIGSHPDDWGARALTAWLARLNTRPEFDPSAMSIVAGARLIDQIYGH